MRVVMLETVALAEGGYYRRGGTYNVADEQAREWEHAGVARLAQAHGDAPEVQAHPAAPEPHGVTSKHEPEPGVIQGKRSLLHPFRRRTP